MSSFFKKHLFLYFLLVSINLHSQDLTEIANTWKDGEYAHFGDGQAKLGIKQKISFIKNDKQVVEKIMIGDRMFRASFVINPYTRYYENSDKTVTEFLYLSDKSIVHYSMNTYTENNLKFIAVYGSKVKEEPIDIVKNYLIESTKYRQYTGVLFYNDIKTIEAVAVTRNNVPLGFDTPFELGLMLTFKNGWVVKTKNLGGTSPLDSYKLVVAKGAVSKDIDGKKWFVADCKTIGGTGMAFKVSPNSDVQTRNGSPWGIKEVNIPFTCANANTIDMKRVERWSKYDEIGFTLKGNDAKTEKVMLQKKPDIGYTDKVAEIGKMFRKSEPDFRLICVKLNGKYGYTDTLGNVVIPIEYDGASVNNFTSKLIAVKKGDKWGLIDLQNKVVTPFIYNFIYDYFRGRANFKLNDKIGILNEKGIEIVKPVYDKVWGFSNGAAVVMKDGKYGFVSENGTTIGTMDYDDAFNFSENGNALVKKNQKFGFIDMSGKTVIPIDQEVLPKELNAQLFKVGKNGLFGIMNKQGKLIVDYKYTEIYPVGQVSIGFKNKLAESLIRVKDAAEYGFIKTDGTVFIECKYVEAEDFYDNMAKVTYRENNVTYKGFYLLDQNTEAWDEKIDDKGNVASTTNSTTTTKSTTATKTSTTCLILNDLTQDQMGGKNSIKLGFTGFRLATSYIARGKTLEVDCDDVIVYKLKNENSSEKAKGYDLFNTKGKCGQTIKLSEFW